MNKPSFVKTDEPADKSTGTKTNHAKTCGSALSPGNLRLRALGYIALLSLLFPAWASATNDYAIVGDSISKEYSVEGPELWKDLLPFDYNDYIKAIKARNWMEVLIARRGSEFNFGPYGTRTDSRLPAGHSHNWAVPASTTADWQGSLNGSTALDQFLLGNFDSDLRYNVNRVVIFLGANDLSNNYGTYYNGADPAAFISSMLYSYNFIVQHIKANNATAQIVICTAPDVGASPNIQDGYPDPAKRALVTSLTETLNAGIAQLAAQQGLGLADIYAFTREYLTSGTITIDGIPLIKGSDKGNYPTYIFSEDRFHPNTCAQALFANEIIQAFNDTFQAGIAPLTELEIVRYLESQHDVQLPIPAAPLIPTPTGSFYHDFSGTIPLWDVSGSYTGIVGQNIGLDFSVNQDPSGKLTGTGTLNSDDGSGNALNGNISVNGTVKSSGSATLVSMTDLVTSGTGTLSVGGSLHNMTFTDKIKFNADLDSASGNLIVNQGFSNVTEFDLVTVKNTIVSTRIGPGALLPLPADVTGDWDMMLILTATGTSYSGTATVQTLPGKTVDLSVTGSFSSDTNTSKIILKDNGCNLKMVVTISGTNMIVHTVKGKIYGQKLNYTAP